MTIITSRRAITDGMTPEQAKARIAELRRHAPKLRILAQRYLEEQNELDVLFVHPAQLRVRGVSHR